MTSDPLCQVQTMPPLSVEEEPRADEPRGDLAPHLREELRRGGQEQPRRGERGEARSADQGVAAECDRSAAPAAALSRGSRCRSRRSGGGAGSCRAGARCGGGVDLGVAARERDEGEDGGSRERQARSGRHGDTLRERGRLMCHALSTVRLGRHAYTGVDMNEPSWAPQEADRILLAGAEDSIETIALILATLPRRHPRPGLRRGRRRARSRHALGAGAGDGQLAGARARPAAPAIRRRLDERDAHRRRIRRGQRLRLDRCRGPARLLTAD